VGFVKYVVHLEEKHSINIDSYIASRVRQKKMNEKDALVGL